LELEETSGTFFYIIIDVNLVVSTSIFLNGLANEGGAIYISGDASVRFSSCTFTGNRAKTLGGAIYSVGFISLEVSGGSQLSNNTALVSGDDFYVGNTEN
jgi:predicted outer membrane repeat protein